MSKTDKAAVPAVQEQSRDLLAMVRDYYPNVSEEQKQGLALWSTFEELCTLPFIPKTAAAEFGDSFLFTILRIGEQTRTSEFLNPVTGEVQRTEQYVILVRVDTDCDLPLAKVDRTIKLHKGDRAIVSYPSGPALREYAIATLQRALQKSEELPGFYMEELEAANPMMSGPIVLRCIFTGSELFATSNHEQLPV